MSDLFMDMHQRRLQRMASARLSRENGLLENHGMEEEENEEEMLVACDNDNDNDNDAIDGEQTDAFANLLSLKLRKPKHWKWELSMSRSCTNIALPRILLYDHKGALLCDANSQQEQVFRQPEAAMRRRSSGRRQTVRRAATSALAHSIRAALDGEFDGLQIEEATPSPSPEPHRRPSSVAAFHAREIAFSTNDLPNDYKFERRSSSLKGVRFKVEDGDRSAKPSSTNSIASLHLVDLPTPPSTSTTLTTTPTATTTGSSSSGPREKRRYRRSQSSSGRSPAHSESILERFSYQKGRFSSPEYAQEHDVYHAPRYFLRTSKAGTLVVQAESFSRYRRRRRQRHSSSEHLRNDSNDASASVPVIGQSQRHHLKVPGDRWEPPFGGGSLQNVAERRQRRPLRRYRSDGNVLLNEQLSTSEEEAAAEAAQRRRRDTSPSITDGHKRKHTHFRRPSKRELVTIDPENGVLRTSFGSPTGR